MRARSGVALGLAVVVLSAIFAPVWSGSTDVSALDLDASSGEPGTVLEIRGWGFSAADEAPRVVVRWDTLDGEMLAVADPDEAGRIRTHVNVPDDAEPGFHVLVATQGADGEERTRTALPTPARASFLVIDPRPQPPGTSG